MTDTLFDEYGRRAPAGLKASVHAKTRRRFVCGQPKIDYAAIHDRISRHLNCAGAISVADFQARAEAAFARVKANPATADMTNAVHVPFFLPKIADATSADIGARLDEVFMPAVEKSFVEMFTTHVFNNHHKGGLADHLSVLPGSRHQVLLDKVTTETVVGVLFIALEEYSIPAAVEQMATLPDGFVLNGGYDTFAAFIGSPQLLYKKDTYPPLVWLAALAGEKPGVGYHFEAYGYNLTFNRRVHFDEAAEYWSSGIVVLG